VEPTETLFSLQRAKEPLIHSLGTGKRWKQPHPLPQIRTGHSSPYLEGKGFLAGEEVNTSYEEEIARRWWALPLNVNLPLSNGESCQLLYPGRPGGSPGPDIRDAVLSFTSCRSGTGYAGVNSQQAENAVGDVEIHIRAFSRPALLLDALHTLLYHPLATAHEPV
jgi:hypothetical protein